MHASDTAEITFEDARIPQDYLIGEQGKGFLYQMQTFQNERMLVDFTSFSVQSFCFHLYTHSHAS